MLERFWCWLGLHRWLGPGLECESCGYPDVLFDTPERAERRLAAWRDRAGD